MERPVEYLHAAGRWATCSLTRKRPNERRSALANSVDQRPDRDAIRKADMALRRVPVNNSLRNPVARPVAQLNLNHDSAEIRYNAAAPALFATHSTPGNSHAGRAGKRRGIHGPGAWRHRYRPALCFQIRVLIAICAWRAIQFASADSFRGRSAHRAERCSPPNGTADTELRIAAADALTRSRAGIQALPAFMEQPFFGLSLGQAAAAAHPGLWPSPWLLWRDQTWPHACDHMSPYTTLGLRCWSQP